MKNIFLHLLFYNVILLFVYVIKNNYFIYQNLKMSDDGCDLDTLLDVLSDDDQDQTPGPLEEEESLGPETNNIVGEEVSDEAEANDNNDEEEEIRKQVSFLLSIKH